MQLKSYLTALSRVFVEMLIVVMLIVVMLIQFIGNRLRSRRYVLLFTKARCRPDAGPLYPIHIHVGSIRLISIFFSYLRSHLERNFFLNIFPIKMTCIFLASPCLLCALPTSSPWFNIGNLLKPTGYVMHQQFNIQQLYALPTLYLCVLYFSENKQRLVPLTA